MCKSEKKNTSPKSITKTEIKYLLQKWTLQRKLPQLSPEVTQVPPVVHAPQFESYSSIFYCRFRGVVGSSPRSKSSPSTNILCSIKCLKISLGATSTQLITILKKKCTEGGPHWPPLTYFICEAISPFLQSSACLRAVYYFGLEIFWPVTRKTCLPLF